jgi:signal peptidase I
MQRPSPVGVRGTNRLKAALARHRLLLDLLLGATFVVVVHMFVVQISIVKGHSMEPSLWDGDRLMVDCVSCAFGEVQRGDVVVLRYPRNPDVDFVKRIVGLPGDRVALRCGQLYVNGVQQGTDWTCIADADNMDELVVPADNYFVLGDNRPISCDSREFGLVDRALLKGRVRARLWPLERLGLL